MRARCSARSALALVLLLTATAVRGDDDFLRRDATSLARSVGRSSVGRTPRDEDGGEGGRAKENMNGDYVLSRTPGGGDASRLFPTRYADYPGEIDYFDVYSPEISQLYSQVFWKGLPPVTLPERVVRRYRNGSAVAIVGFEVNQVRIDRNGEEVTIPYSACYNHHFESTMIGGSATFQQVRRDDPRLSSGSGHGLPDGGLYVVSSQEPEDEDLPTQQAFGAANGGEARRSFHGYAPGFAQVIKSPHSFQITPMQIDTWNRDEMDLDDPTVRFVPGPVPRQSIAPTSGPDAIYSGLLECPLTTRVEKKLDSTYAPKMQDVCANLVSSTRDCFDATASLLSDFTTFSNHSVVDDPTVANGCSVSVSQEDVSTANVYFNEGNESSRKCGEDVSIVVGRVHSLVRVTLSVDENVANITVEGPEDVWFGVGFGAQAMKDAPWAVIVDGHGNVTERKLADQSPGTLLDPSITVVSMSTSSSIRTIVLTRPRQGHDDRYFTFDLKTPVVPIINAVGSTVELSYHKDKSPAQLSLVPVGRTSGACVCASPPKPFGKQTGSFVYHANASQSADAGSGTVAFGNVCAPRPRTDLLAQKNPTCDLRTYVGGQTTCHHMWSLLDADQEIPWTSQPLRYKMKFRFWYQDYNASYHQNVKRTTWGIASPVEYDVPKCSEGIEGCSVVNGTWIHTITGTFQGSGKLVAAHFHCHAPTCLSVQLYRNDTGELICREDPVYGTSDPGFILQPPCLWGDAAYGLEPPPDVNGVMLHAVKTANATYGHHGEMAWLQMLYV